MQEDDKYTVTERTALVVVRLTKGERLRTVDVAEALGMTWGGAWRLMVRISLVAPLTQDDTGAWYILRDCVD